MKDKKSWQGSVKKLLIVLLAVLTLCLFFCFFNEPLPPLIPAQCTFPVGITCVNDNLNPNLELDLTIGQGTGKTMNITGVACTQSQIQPSYINNYASDPITVQSGEAKVVSKFNTSHTVICTDANGNAMLNLTDFGAYIGTVYINYTEVETGQAKVAVGLLQVKVYPSVPSPVPCWKKSPCSCLGGLGCTPLLIVAIFWVIVIGYYLFFPKPKQS